MSGDWIAAWTFIRLQTAVEHSRKGGAVWPTVEVVAAVAIAGAAQTISGVGFALIASPLLIFALGHADGVRLAVAMALLLNAAVLAGTVRAVRWGDALRMLIPAAVVVIPTMAVSNRLNTVTLSAVAGVAILLSVALMASGRRAHWADGTAGTITAGAASGILNVIGAVSGPPIALLVAHRSWAPRESTATVQAYSLPLNAITLPVIGLPTARPLLVLWAGVGLFAGIGIAWPFVGRISAKTVRLLVLALAAVGGTSLIAAAIF